MKEIPAEAEESLLDENIQKTKEEKTKALDAPLDDHDGEDEQNVTDDNRKDVHDILSHLDDRNLEATLVLSDFLTKFHSFCDLSAGRDKVQGGGGDDDVDDDYSNDNETKKTKRETNGKKFRTASRIVISPLDILSAMEYRQDLERYKVASTLYHNCHESCENKNKAQEEQGSRYNDIDKLLQDSSRQWMEYEKDRLWTRMQNRITTTSSGRMSTDEDVDSLITALKVKLSKEMSTQLLLKPSIHVKSMVQQSDLGDVGEDDKDVGGIGDDEKNWYNKSKRNSSVVHLPCSSTLLNMPTENYLSTFLPSKQFVCVHPNDGIMGEEKEYHDNDVDDDDDGDDDDNKDSQSETISLASSSSSSHVGPKPTVKATLAIPANYLTSQELLRISSMISKVPIQDLEAVHSSPLTYSIMTGFDYKHYIDKDRRKHTNQTRSNLLYTKEKSNAEDKLLIGVNSTIRGTDLLALWIRAQRDTSASRHLLALFDITPWQREEHPKQNKKSKGEENVIDLNSVDSDHENAIEVQKQQQQQQQQGNQPSIQSNGIPKEISFAKNNCVESATEATNYSMAANQDPRYTATYVGNPSKMRIRIEKEAPMLDRLVEWAVMNQILYTQEYMRERLSVKAQHEKVDNDVCMVEQRGQEDTTSGIEHNVNGASVGCIQMNLQTSRKRSSPTNLIREESNSKKPRLYGDISPPELQIAYQSYILRWFVRRNYDVLKIVLTSKKNPSSDEDSEDESSAFGNMTTQIKNYLRDTYASTDRTFDRIDRRILIGKFSSFRMFVDAVDQLLEALDTAYANDKSSLVNVDTAKKDFHELCRIVFTRITENGDIQSDYCKVEETSKVLRALPRPWHDDKCHSCHRRANKADRVICQNCGMCVHKGCLSQQPSLLPSPPLNDNTLKYLKAIYFSSETFSCTSDFVTNPVAWEKRKIVMQRERVDGSGFPKWGLTLQNTEQCEELYNKYYAYFLSPSKWERAELLNSSSCETYLAKLPHSGLLITKSVGPALNSGLKEGDVIVEIEILGEDTKHCLLKDIKRSKERQKYFQAQTDKITLTVFRPSKDVIASAKNFREVVTHVHKKVAEMHHKLTNDRWYCHFCKKSYDVSTIKQSDEASVCQRVLQRLAMEQCFLPFHDENLSCAEYADQNYNNEDDAAISIESDSSNETNSSHRGHFKHICLRRLDRIMDMIKDGSNHGKSVLYAPPWCRRERLCWINRNLLKNPTRLLCTGMFLIIEQAKSRGYKKNRIDELIAAFIRTFVPACFDHIGDCDKRQYVDSGRKLLPWFSISCENCFVRPARYNELKCDFCINAAMNTVMAPVDRQGPEVKSKRNSSEEVTFHAEKVLSHEMIKYDLYTSFIGTSFIVDMDDPLILGVCEKTKLLVGEGRRNVELLIISYVPQDLLSRKERNYLVYEQFSEMLDKRQAEANGLFFILPVLSSLQLDFISKLCHINVTNQCPSDSEMLKLEGMIALTPSELLSRLEQSSHMITALNRSVTSIVMKFGSTELPMMIFENRNDDTPSLQIVARDGYDTLSALTFARTENEPDSFYRFSESCLLASGIDYVVSSSAFDKILSLCETNTHSFCLHNRGHYYPGNVRHRKSKHFKKKNQDETRSSSMLSILYGLVTVEPFQAQKNGECELCYSDLIHWDPRNKNRMTKSEKIVTYAFNQMKLQLSKISLLKPVCPLNRSNRSEYKEFDFVMYRDCDDSEEDFDPTSDSDSDEEYSPQKGDDSSCNNEFSHPKFYGKGWGMELIRWFDEKHHLRVGRIAPSSPAAKCGLKPHDVVKCINGIPIHECHHSTVDLADILLGESCILEKGQKVGNDATILYLNALRNKAPVRGPIVLKILRSDKNRKSAVENSSKGGSAPMMTAPQSQKSTQTNARSNRSQQNIQNNHSYIHSTAKSHRTLINWPPPFKSPVEILDRKHLYRSGVNGTFLTIAETAVMMMAIELNHPKLSLRLLSPRYPSHRVNEEYVYRIKPFLENNGMFSIPKLNERMWNKVLEYDHLRIQKEVGPIIFYENNYGYREANIRFPIDKLFENYFDNNQERQSQRTDRLHHRETGIIQNHQSYPHRLRSTGDPTNLVNNYSYPPILNSDQMYKAVNVRGGDSYVSGFRSHYLDRANQTQLTEDSNTKTSSTSESDLNHAKSQPARRCDQATSSDKSHVDDLPTTKGRTSENNMLTRGDEENTSSTNDLRALELNDSLSNLGKVVIGYDKLNKHNILLGIVVKMASSTDTFTVKLLHDTATGTFSSPKTCNIDAKSFFALPNITCTESASNIVRKAIPYIRSLEKKSAYCHDMTSMASEVLNTSPSTLLGVLPDGRSLHWFSSDPIAIYIHDHENCEDGNHILKGNDDILLAFHKNSHISKTKNQPFLDVNFTKDLIFCPWGCCIIDNRAYDQTEKGYPLLTFNTTSALKDHIMNVHTYNSYLGDKSIRRICEGRLIRDLCADLTIYLCSLSGSLRRFTHSYQNNREYPAHRSIIFDPISWRGLSYECLALLEDNAPLILSAIKLWDRLDHLFCIEGDGTFRSQNRDRIHDSTAESLSRIHSDEMKLFKVIDTGLKNAELALETCNNHSFHSNPSCYLCRDCRKPTVKSKGSRIENGVGCALLSNLYFEFDHSETRNKLLRATNDAASVLSDLNAVKALLFNVAANVPRSLYATKMHIFTDSPRCNFWDDIDTWISFSRRCINTRMIAQAYIALQSSINKQKMPKWWRTGKSGWSSSLVILQNPTVSSVSLLIFVLDIAISEFMTTNTKQLNNHPQSARTSEKSPQKLAPVDANKSNLCKT
jgi:hypothetical protein